MKMHPKVSFPCIREFKWKSLVSRTGLASWWSSIHLCSAQLLVVIDPACVKRRDLFTLLTW